MPKGVPNKRYTPEFKKKVLALNVFLQQILRYWLHNLRLLRLECLISFLTQSKIFILSRNVDYTEFFAVSARSYPIAVVDFSEVFCI